MKKKNTSFAIFILLVIALILLGLYIGAGFDLVIESQTPIYISNENKPFREREILTQLMPGDQAISLGCFDVKTDLFFYVTLQDGRAGYLYDFNFTSHKRLIPTTINFRYLVSHPLSSLQCLIMIPEYSRT